MRLLQAIFRCLAIKHLDLSRTLKDQDPAIVARIAALVCVQNAFIAACMLLIVTLG